jgi:hypothetical protein
MDIFKKFALIILSPLFIFLLFATAFDIGFVRTTTHPATVKKLVAESGIYNSVIPNLLQQTKSINTNVGAIDTSNPLIKKAANQAITPQYVQQNTEAAIDSVYKWLDGGVAQPDFKIDLNGVKDSFASNAASSVQQQLASLPACTTAAEAAFNALNATCLPRGVSPASAAAQLKDSLISNQDFLNQTNLTAANIKNNGSNKSIFQDQLKDAPKQYQKAKKTPFILGLLTILAGVGIVLLSSTWQKGFRHVGLNLVIIGLLMLLFSYVLNRGVHDQLVPKIKLDNALLQTDVRNLVSDLTRQIDKNYWFFGGLYTVLGAAAIGSEMFIGRGPRHPKTVESTATPKSTAGAPPTQK